MPVSDSNRPVSVTLWPPLAIISAVAATFAVVEAVTSVWADRQGSAAWAAKQFSSQADRHAVDAELKEVLVLAGFIFFAALSISFMNAKWRHDRKRAVAFGKLRVFGWRCCVSPCDLSTSRKLLGNITRFSTKLPRSTILCRFWVSQWAWRPQSKQARHTSAAKRHRQPLGGELLSRRHARV